MSAPLGDPLYCQNVFQFLLLSALPSFSSFCVFLEDNLFHFSCLPEFICVCPDILARKTTEVHNGIVKNVPLAMFFRLTYRAQNYLKPAGYRENDLKGNLWQKAVLHWHPKRSIVSQMN